MDFNKHVAMMNKYGLSVPKKWAFAQPTSREVRPVDPVLTSLSIGFKNDNFFWDMIGPVAEQQEKSATYFVYDREFWFRRQEGAERAPEGESLRTGYGVSTQTYDAFELSFEKALGDVVVDASQTPENLATQDTQFLTNLMQLELEARAAAAYFVTGVWGTSNTLTGTDQWSDFANSDPIANADTAINTILQNTGAMPNTMFIGKAGWDKLKEHPLILDKYKHTQTGIMTPELVAPVLGVDEIVVGSSVNNSAAEGATFSGAFTWTDSALFLVRNNPALGVANGAYTFLWNRSGNNPWAVESYREDKRVSEINRIFTHVDFRVVSAQHGYIFLDLVA